MGAAERIDAPESNVVPIRWTARGFVRAGVVFAIGGATITVSGPAGRADIYEALKSEVKRRTDVFVKFAPLDPRSPFPRVALPGVSPVRSGACDVCGDALEPGRGGMCPLCSIALQKVLRQLGRIP
jgi:hypothetical protein